MFQSLQNSFLNRNKSPTLRNGSSNSLGNNNNSNNRERSLSDHSLDKTLANLRQQFSDWMLVDTDVEDPELECMPTFRQASFRSIQQHLSNDLITLKNFDSVITTRLNSYKHYLDTSLHGLKQINNDTNKVIHDVHKSDNVTTRTAINAMQVYFEQEVQQARLQSDLKQCKSELDSQRRIANMHKNEYETAINNASNIVKTAEKQLYKADLSLSKLVTEKKRLDVEMHNLKVTNGYGSGSYDRESSSSPITSNTFDGSSTRSNGNSPDNSSNNINRNRGRSHSNDSGGGSDYGYRSSSPPVPSPSPPTSSSVRFAQRASNLIKGNNNPTILGENIQKLETKIENSKQDLKTKIDNLKSSMRERDEVWLGCIDAYQSLCKVNKHTMRKLLLDIVETEKGSLEMKRLALEAFENAVNNIDIDSDEQNFIDHNRDERSGLVLLSQAMGLLDELGSKDTNSTIIYNNNDDDDDDDDDSSSRSRSSSTRNKHVSMSLDLLESESGQSIDEIYRLIGIVFTSIDTTDDGESTYLSNPDGVMNVKSTSDMNTNKNNGKNIVVDANMRAQRTAQVVEAIETLKQHAQLAEGREIIVNGLNQFRSRKVNVDTCFKAVGKLLWEMLDVAFEAGDTRCARVIMMLSQTFYRHEEEKISSNSESSNDLNTSKDTDSINDKTPGKTAKVNDHNNDNNNRNNNNNNGSSSSNNNNNNNNSSSSSNTNTDIDWSLSPTTRLPREYLKTQLYSHRIWHDNSCRFWEQTLWQLVIEQLPTIKLEMPWFHMTDLDRSEIAAQIHEIIFSQVMAISHSMKEMNCNSNNIRSFIYRMCSVHQLNEFQRHTMLQHLRAPRDY